MSEQSQDLSNITAAKVVDARSVSCPGPLLEAKKSIGLVKVGEVLEVWSGGKDTRKSLSRWCKKLGHDFLGFIDEGGYDRLFVRRNK